MPGPPPRQHEHIGRYTPFTHTHSEQGEDGDEDDNDGQMISGDHKGRKLPDVCLTGMSNYSGLLEDPEYYSYRYRIIGTFFQSSVFLVGVAGNIMVVTVVLHSRSMRTPTNCYLVSLAIADTVVLFAAVPNEILSYFLVGNLWLWGNAGCAVLVFCQNLGINASSLSLVAFTVERYIAICNPLRAQAMCTVGRAKRITFGVWTFAISYCSPWLVLAGTNPLYYKGLPDGEICQFKLPRHQYLVYFFTDLLLFYIVPLLLSCILYTLIARGIYSQRRPSANTVHTGAARMQVIKMLVMVVAVFAILWLPYRGMLVYNSFATLFKRKPFMDLWFLMFAKTCVYINCAINPILYNAMSIKFRRAFHRTLACSHHNQHAQCPSTSSNSSRRRNKSSVINERFCRIGLSSSTSPP